MKKLVYVLITLIILPAASPETEAQRISRDLNVDLLVNQAGYVPHTGKVMVTKGIRTSSFDIVDLESRQVVYSGKLKPCPGDFGGWSAGDFSSLLIEGHYYIKCDTLRSFPFEISKTVYRKPMENIVGYFSLQRCGSSTTGYLSPCHTDDGIRMDNGRHQDVTGGWHDASDLRKWVGATIYGMIGLSRAYELLGENDPARIRILDELLWGNQYFLKMQEPEGYIMNFVGGDVKKHSDSNRWTDNIVGPEGGELAFVKPTAGSSTADMLLFGSNDDRVIRTDPLDLVGQYNFISSEAIMARITRTSDPDYSDRCLQAAVKCFDWCTKTDRDESPAIIGASMQAGNELFKTTGKDTWFSFAAGQATKLRKLQAAVRDQNTPAGFFYAGLSGREPFKDIWQGCLGFISACDMIMTNPAHRDIGVCKQLVSDYSQLYLKTMAGKNSFGIVPYGLFDGKDPGGGRKVGEYWYRYFMQPGLSWWVGINSNLASAGVGLIKASKVLNDPDLKALAQRQLDWIIGVNPFNSSTIVSVGYNNPVHFPGSTFIPRTPVLPGAVLNGLGGDTNDQPDIGDGDWQISEYWTPMVAFTLWLLTEFTAAE